MPYIIKSVKGGYKVCTRDIAPLKKSAGSQECFSKKPLTKKKAEAQRRAIYASENKSAGSREGTRDITSQKEVPALEEVSRDIAKSAGSREGTRDRSPMGYLNDPSSYLNMVVYNYQQKTKTEEETIPSEEMKAVLNPNSFEEFYMGKKKDKAIVYDIFLKIFEKEYDNELSRKKDFEFFWNNYNGLDYSGIESKIQIWYKDPEAKLRR